MNIYINDDNTIKLKQLPPRTASTLVNQLLEDHFNRVASSIPMPANTGDFTDLKKRYDSRGAAPFGKPLEPIEPRTPFIVDTPKDDNGEPRYEPTEPTA
jgi:hypothetical protein